MLDARSIYFEAFAEGLRPPPLQTVAEWSERNVVLPKGTTPEPGPWRNTRAPYLVEIMEALSATDPTRLVSVMTGAQMGKTSLGNNWLGYVIDQDPAPTMFVLPTVDIAKDVSKERLAPMVAATACLKAKVEDSKSRDSASTILNKRFPGGRLLLRGANSAAGLASVPIEKLYLDEVDRYPMDVDGEGDPVGLALKRTITFPRRKILETSTPVDLSTSRIWRGYQASDKRRYWVPCPDCGGFFLIEWGLIQFERSEDYKLIGEPWLECPHCKARVEEKSKPAMLEAGKWVAEAPEVKDHAGFWINGLYSPWNAWRDIVVEFLAARAERNVAMLKLWTNTILAEPWDDAAGEALDPGSLIRRAEKLDPLPEEVLVLTAGADVQDDRLEIIVKGWGIGRESWTLDSWVIPGSPALGSVWDSLDAHLARKFNRADGAELGIVSTCIDSGGHFTQAVYDYVKPRMGRRIFAVKGSNQQGRPIIERGYGRKAGGKLPIFLIGTDTAKEDIFHRLGIDEEGPGFCHFSDRLDLEYYRQLTAEKLVKKYERGREVRKWVKRRDRNEALDCEVYALAAMNILNPDFVALAKKSEPKEKPKKARKRRPSGWVSGY